MSAKLTADLKEALSGEMTPKFLATLGEGGKPNVVPVISIVPYDDETLVFGEFLMNKSRKNLLACDKVGIAVFTEKLRVWSLKGTFLGFETSGEHVDFVNGSAYFRYNAYSGVRAAGLIRVEEATPGRKIGKARLALDLLRVSASAAFPRGRRNGSPKMPRQVEEKFSRLAAVRAAAFLDADGVPRAFPLLACRSAGPNRLLLADPFLDEYAPPPGGEMAACVITFDPIAYQVKGRYNGRERGVGVLDIAECYSASPPLLGERLDR